MTDNNVVSIGEKGGIQGGAGGSGSGMGERQAAIEAVLPHLATKNDVRNVKV